VIAIASRTEAVEAALREAGELEPGDEVRDVEQLPGGWSRHSFVAHAALGDGHQRRYIVRVKPTGALLDTDLALEYRVYTALAGTGLPAPRVYAFVSSDDTPFDGPFIVMEHIDGTAPNMYSRSDQARLADDWAGPRTIADDMVEHLARIHGLQGDELPADLPELDFDAVVARWRSVYEERHLVRDPVIEEAFEWVAGRAPREPWPGLVHGDYRIGNTLIAGGRVRAVTRSSAPRRSARSRGTGSPPRPAR